MKKKRISHRHNTFVCLKHMHIDASNDWEKAHGQVLNTYIIANYVSTKVSYKYFTVFPNSKNKHR